MQKLLIGRIVKPQGIKGEVKVLLLTDGFFSVKNLKFVYLNDKPYAINSIKDAGVPCAYIAFDGVTDRNAAETLRGVDVYADKSLINKEKNAYFIEDLIGLTVIAGEEKFGVVKEVIKSNVDMFVINCGQGVAYMPFLKSLKSKIDLNAKTITVDKEKFYECLTYEN